MEFVADPGGSGKVVLRMDVFGNDIADQWGGTRTSLFRNGQNCSGCEAWTAFAFYIPVGFQYPDDWFTLYQMFYPSGGSPPISLELRTHNGGNQRNHLYWSNRAVSGGPAILTPLGQVHEGSWHYIVQHTRFLFVAGFNRVWLGYGDVPDTSRPPLVNWLGGTLFGSSSGRENILLYRGASALPSIRRCTTAAFTRPLMPRGRKSCPTAPRHHRRLLHRRLHLRRRLLHLLLLQPPPPPPPPPAASAATAATAASRHLHRPQRRVR